MKESMPNKWKDTHYFFHYMHLTSPCYGPSVNFVGAKDKRQKFITEKEKPWLILHNWKAQVVLLLWQRAKLEAATNNYWGSSPLPLSMWHLELFRRSQNASFLEINPSEKESRKLSVLCSTADDQPGHHTCWPQWMNSLTHLFSAFLMAMTDFRQKHSNGSCYEQTSINHYKYAWDKRGRRERERDCKQTSLREPFTFIWLLTDAFSFCKQVIAIWMPFGLNGQVVHFAIY